MRNFWVAQCLSATALFCMIGGCGLIWPDRIAGRASEESTPAERAGPPDFIALANKVRPVVVHVSATPAAGARKRDSSLPDQAMDDPPEQLFGVPPQAAPQAQSLGTGIIIARDGTILTNAHVVTGADRILVRLSDKREFPGTVVGRDLKLDIAIIKIQSDGELQPARLGDSDRLQVGEWVMAVGSPFGLDDSVTSGIVSATGRHIGAGPYDDFIQTNASINPGNSGGPLVNGHGEVVGLNMAMVSEGGGNSGIAFATPINLVKEVLPQLERTGKITRGWAGVAVQETDFELSRSLGFDKPHGALVAGLAQTGPAERSGIRLGDVITEYDGKPVTEAAALPLMIARTPVGKQVAVKLVRKNKTFDVRVRVERAPESDRQERTPPAP